ncbi:hypothetical protein RGU70_08020 [Herbaspirillum sp. RTI4]|uniref:lipopolysaccharide biosynthesis protein n=1 Tax=Herbaspirillum sp. RTI4 TaxID=3048640 RepID=UPI002AB3B15F|nr:hypothetical protein [Herbaspirillum sp. RTI4]MDY7578265.1 hypothetical protein [Herbaspirillum sp. RTI4]MEA9981242.1 hypothetical protein [Herbaspirillum sp. RTI4]
MARPHPQPVSRRKLLVHSLASLGDQALLSGLNLLLGLLLIRLASKTAYGVYSQLIVGGIFAFTILEALITGPLTTLAPARSDDSRARLIAHLTIFQWQVSAALALLFGVAAALLTAGADAHPLQLGAAFAIYIFANALREYRRSIAFIEGKPHHALQIDIAYGLGLAVGISLLVLLRQLSIPGVLLVLGLANVLALWRGKTPIPSLSTPDAKSDYRADLRDIWRRGRWALPGAMVAWFTNYSYLYLAALWLGVAASAELNASRLLLMPISLSVLAWSRVARPMVTRLLAAGDWKNLDRLAWVSVLCIELLTVAYVAVLWWSLPWLVSHLLGSKYSGLDPLVLAWGLYFAINAARWIGSSWLTSNDQYPLLLISGIACLLVMLAATSIVIPLYGAWGAILALVIVEAFDFVLIWMVLLPMLKRRRKGTPT